MWILEADDYEFGVHCRKGRSSWSFGPHAFSARHLLETYKHYYTRGNLTLRSRDHLMIT